MKAVTRDPRRILVVDDEEHITELVAMGLTYNGFEVERVGTGRAALAAVERRRPDLIVLDVMLPDLDGFEMGRRRRACGGGRRCRSPARWRCRRRCSPTPRPGSGPG